MAFRPVSPKVKFPQVEEQVLKFWREHEVFRKTEETHRGGPEFVFYEGPPTANGRPGVHHVLSRSFKDIFPRYKVMRGYHVIRRGGWDTHGLPVELEVEKKLGFTSKRQIEEYGVAKFNKLCRQSVFEYIQDWEKLTERIAFWVDLDNAYVTYRNEYIESIWWILKNFWDRGLLYKDYKVVPYCPRCGTPLADHEVALGYKETEDPSVYVRMPLVDEEGTSLLVWTTTPWTLPANVAVAAHPEVTYVKIRRPLPDGGEECLILAEPLLQAVFGEEPVEVVERFPGKALQGRRYRPLFTFVPLDKPAHFVVLQDFVTTEDGTGLVHMAPAFGAEDMQTAKEHDLPVVLTVNPDGTFIQAVRPWAGMFVKDADPLIIEDLERRGLLFRAGTYEHTYPFCWRCSTPLLYYARSTWYIRTTDFKDRLVALNEEINWVPAHIKHGRFGNWLENNIDWALGRERYWGTPLPIWECQHCGHREAVGSVAELSEKVGRDLSGMDLHRPYVDEVTYTCSECGGVMKRVPELIDVWFDSGSMPVAQWHYPFENQETFQKQFPADFICEAVDQTRGWFYSLHAISTLLFDSVAFKNVVCLGLILDEKGQKMSKSRGNVVNPWDVLNVHGADALRWYLYTAGPPGDNRRFSVNLVGEVVQNFLLTLWNVYAFFVTYANLDGWQPDPNRQPAYSDLDRWLRSYLHTLVRDVTQALESYDALGATRPIETFVERLSNWYLRRSRRRFWRGASGDDEDKYAAYATLYEALVTLSHLIAPSMPFLAEELYQNLVRSVNPEAAESVHLATWPEVDEEAIDEALNREMELVMRLASLGHAARAQAGIKVRQPLPAVAFAVGRAGEGEVVRKYADLLADELNVKEVRLLGSAGEALTYSLKPLPKQLGQKYKSLFPKIRQAILALEASEASQRLLAGQSIQVTVDGTTYDILPEEVEVIMEARTGMAVASEGAYLAALDTTITPELRREGLAREFVRRVQNLRKEAGLEVADRIRLTYQATPDLAEAVEAFREYIMGEVLAVEMQAAEPPTEVARAEAAFDGEKVTLGIVKA
ncbi:MAG TPA: isoleucine--tRNA ligase [Anaerolineaceae bacterium]|nr:isoleucine--tRNA ligase [Anaerolineaceae bacterium]